MSQSISHVALLVRDYDEALAYFTEFLGFQIVEDTALGNGKRWVLVAPPQSSGAALLLAKVATPEQTAYIGNQTGGRVFLFLHTSDFWRDYNAMRERGVDFVGEPRQEIYGMVVIFKDLYGNRWDFVEQANL